MSSVKVKYRPSTVDAKTGTIYYQVIHNRIPRQISTGYSVRSDEWDKSRSVLTSSPTAERRLYLLAIRDAIRRDVGQISKIAARLACRSMDFTSDDIVDGFRRYRSHCSFVGYMEAIISALRQNGRHTTACNYRSALNSFRRFLSETQPLGFELYGANLMLDSLTSETMERYQAWQKGRGLCSNTISFYIRIIRAVYRRAVEEEAIDDLHPFRRVYTGVDKTVKRALPITLIRKIKMLDLSLSPVLDYTRDMFMLSFYLRGMSFVDMAFLKKTDLRDGCITYRRRKTGRLLKICWTAEMQTILEKYPENDSDYLLPIIRRRDINERCAYRNAGYLLNLHLKEIGRLVGAPDSHSWSFYRARHSWASVAHAKGIPLSVISEGMGHDSETTTQIYLASLDTTVVDRANALIISSL